MNKAELKRYMNRKDNRELLKSNCFEYNDKYLVSDSYSIIALSSNYDLHIMEDVFRFYNFIDNFNECYEFNYIINIFEIINYVDPNYFPITDDYGINIKELMKIVKIIKGRKCEILVNKKESSNNPFIIKIVNKDKSEYAYLLPMRCY